MKMAFGQMEEKKRKIRQAIRKSVRNYFPGVNVVCNLRRFHARSGCACSFLPFLVR